MTTSRIGLEKLAGACLVLILALAFTMPVVRWDALMLWHDQQRIAQFGIVAIVAVFAVLSLRARPQLPGVTPGLRWAITLLVLLGLVSASMARIPVWAFTELALMIACLGIGWMVAVARVQLRDRFDRMVLFTLFAVCAAIVVRSIFLYILALQAPEPVIDPWALLTGFSNLRFLGQFASLSLPLLAVPLLVRGLPSGLRVAAAVVLVLWWTVAISSGTRGTLLGMAAAMGVLVLAGAGGRRWVAVHLLAVAVAFLLYMLWMHWIPDWLAVETARTADTRLTTSLSLREELWLRAIELIRDNPLFGVGPMHGADYLNRGPTQVIAHPHQSWLQWASEWGLPSALLVTGLVLRGLWAVFRALRRRGAPADLSAALPVGLLGALLAALTQAMVDGVLVMPYSQLWLAVVGGWLFALHGLAGESFTEGRGKGGPDFGRKEGWQVGALSAWVFMLCVSAAMLGHVVTRDVPRMDTRKQSYHRPYGQLPSPRFWGQGIIGVPRASARAWPAVPGGQAPVSAPSAASGARPAQ